MHLMKVVATGTEAVVEGSKKLADIVTADMLSGVLDEVIDLLPVALPVMIGFIALRKGVSFLVGILHAA